MDGVLLISLSRFCREAKHSESLFFCALSEMMFQDLLEALRVPLQVPEVFTLGTTKLFFAQKQKNRAQPYKVKKIEILLMIGLVAHEFCCE